MKTIKILFAITISLFLNISLFCQDKEPEQVKFLYKGDSVFLNSQHPDFVQDSFMLGWHWGGSIKISHALNMNQFDAHSKHINEKNTIDSSTYLILKSMREWDTDSLKFYTHCDNASQLIRAKAVQYEPTFRKFKIILFF